EGLAGVAAALDYLAEVGTANAACQAQFPSLSGRRLQVHAGLAAVRDYEAKLGSMLLDALADRPRFKVWGITDRQRLRERVPTVAVTLTDQPAGQMAEHLAAQEIYVWSGN